MGASTSGAEGRAAEVSGEQLQQKYASPLSARSSASSRSLLSNASSVLSSQRREWEAAAAQRRELFRCWGPSVKREELKQLTRKQLRRRLADLGAAPTEGDGMLFESLVDTVLLWNALARLHDGHDLKEKQEALLALRDAGLSGHLLQRALLVVGVPAKERRGLKPSAAAMLLFERLQPLVGSECEGLPRAPEVLSQDSGDSIPTSKWRQRVLEAEEDAAACKPIDDVELVQNTIGPPSLDVADMDVSVMDMDGSESCGVRLQESSPDKLVRDSRDAKFAAMDADLRKCLEEIGELEIDDGAYRDDDPEPTVPNGQHSRGRRLTPVIEEDDKDLEAYSAAWRQNLPLPAGKKSKPRPRS